MMPAEERTITVRGRTVHYFQGGRGRPVVYLHGSDGQRGWSPFLARLAERYTVYAPSHPGVAGSTGLDGIDTMLDLAFHSFDVLEAWGLERPALVGLSLGGWLAAEMAAICAHALSHLVLIDAAGLWLPAQPIANIFGLSPRRARALVFDDPDSAVAHAYFPSRPPPEEVAERLRALAVAAKLGWSPYMHDPKLASRLHRIRVPTLVVWGASDRLIPPAYGEAYRRGIPGAALVVLDGVGHIPTVEQPERCAALIGDFLARPSDERP
jgi:pimeloyl-ACP methyl ester carboxylesterase